MKICVCGNLMDVKKVGVKVRPRNYYGYFMADLWHCPNCRYEFLELAEKEIVSNIPVDFDFNELEVI
jgi:hypothetical protein